MFSKGGLAKLPILLLVLLPTASTFLTPSPALRAPSAALHLRSKSSVQGGRRSSTRGGFIAVRSQFGGLFSIGGGGGGAGQTVDPAKFSFFSDKSGGREPVASWASEAGRDKGKAKRNQDAAVCGQVAGLNVFAVFDGHGASGHLVAEYLVDHIAAALDYSLGNPGASADFAVSEAFTVADGWVSQVLGAAAIEQSGATGTVVLQKGTSLLVASVGDSRAVLGSAAKGATMVLTTDHNPASPIEKARIEAAGGTVGDFRGEPDMAISGQGRVFIKGKQFPGLATARAFGDGMGKTVGVSSEPDITCVTRGSSQTVLVIASDGVWDVMDDEDAVETALGFASSRDAATAAAVIVEAARMLWETRPGSERRIDDITACVAFF
mmetsp:Transcript_20252/g.48933  ORF Transcript_20252/g.48933 Transcript_20252/m.48933 type:complete len:380 (+) Transcript_20252:31-1170(+)|eukprot:CAMPEP_0180347968 /NCGR_PEP_ID=MMETSP0989-20121125/4683_1 /TAXON_ID=697907 /ORGANISM="non described non described, Strain CCMP2293" /LENGTH=379 /DNA_ID=CAMNT_0022337189 /DNA_START=22 /DNA_END=1161 /DNA_ORIENTATION=-